MSLRIYSWNVLFQNKRLDEAFRFIESLEFDILCLQEVPVPLFERLKTLPYRMAWSNDVDQVYGARIVRMHLVVLSRHPIQAHGVFPLQVPHLLIRTRVFVKLMRSLGWTKIKNREGLWADIVLPGFAQPVRVFDMHLILAHPEARANDWHAAMKHIPSDRDAIACGDFNTLESPHITILNWILGGACTDFLLPKRERRHMEERFAQQNLKNPLRDQITHFISQSQLDHVLVPRAAKVISTQVLKDSHGSDHRPVCVEIAE